MATSEVSVLLCDQRMSGMDGPTFLSRMRHMYPDVTRMVLSGYTDAVNHGAIFKFLTKPWVEEELDAALHEAFAEYETKRTAPRGVGKP